MNMADVTPVLYFPPQHPLNTTTPSPFTFSVASTAWSSRSSFRLSNLFLRFFALLLSFISALSLSIPRTQKRQNEVPSNFLKYPELMYCFIIAIIAAVYSAYQLFKGVCDIAYRGLFISDKISDYLTFILDQLVCYLLVSSSSVSIPVVDQLAYSNNTSLEKAAIISISMLFACFFVIAICTLLSGYKLCKRIIW